MTKKIALLIASVVASAAAASVPATAQAQDRKSPLADAPAIRHRLELRDKRFEIGAGMGASIGQHYYHAILVNARLGFHLNDWLAIGAVGAFNLTPNLKTSFNERLLGVLSDSSTDRTPTRQQALDGMNKIGQVYAVQAEVVPFTGKFALFSSLFMQYDFYAFGGPGFINFKADAPACAEGTAGSCPVVGMKIGGNFGVGMHAFINDFVAINAELRDILVRNNPAGRDETGDGVAGKDDLSWDSNYILSLNLMFFLPGKAQVSP
jgi:outer membrane beta-barrel protein